jgi:hypothetical protein
MKTALLLMVTVAGAKAKMQCCVEYCGCDSPGVGCRDDCVAGDACGGYFDCRDLGMCIDCSEDENDQGNPVFTLFENTDQAPSNCYPLNSCGHDGADCGDEDIVENAHDADHCCSDEGYCCGFEQCGPVQT